MILHLESSIAKNKGPSLRVVLDADEGLPIDMDPIRNMLLDAVASLPKRTNQIEVVRLTTSK